uniref:Transthyretin-like family-containing protein n=1 Tax=Strongyloides papillosus TaxID=174720 RepID=A0A0N5BV18_STREA
MHWKNFIIFLFLNLSTNIYLIESLESLFTRSVQTVGIKGVFLCNGKPLEHVVLELYEKDTFSFDDLLNRASTDLMGRITFYGSEKEFSTIRPLLKVGHFCNIKGRNMKQIDYNVPQIYVNIGDVPLKYCDLGVVDLSKDTTLQCKSNNSTKI